MLANLNYCIASSRSSDLSTVVVVILHNTHLLLTVENSVGSKWKRWKIILTEDSSFIVLALSWPQFPEM